MTGNLDRRMHAMHGARSIQTSRGLGWIRQCMHVTRKMMKPLACLLLVVSYGAPAGRPVAVSCCVARRTAGISACGACMFLGRRRRSVSVALAPACAPMHACMLPACPRSTSSSARQVPVVWTHAGKPARLHACMPIELT
jgi:hypothetical protein